MQKYCRRSARNWSYIWSVFIFVCLSGLTSVSMAQSATVQHKPLRVAIAGLSHDHVHGFLGKKNWEGIELVGIAEKDHALAEKYSKRYGFPMGIVYKNLQEMIDRVKPDAVLAFNSIYGHLEVVERCAPKGIHVMVEKPLAVSVEHANRMVSLAKKYGIQLITNYETTWYGSLEKAYQLIQDQNQFGKINRIQFHTGHRGPVEIGCSKEFLAWLTDPVLNGGGALTDFGCYGANISTWLMNGEKPISVIAGTRRFKPAIYPNVDDDATIILAYKDAEVIIQPSWNWPFSRKDMELYGQKGFIFCQDARNMVIRTAENEQPRTIRADELPGPRNNPFTYFAGVINGSIKPAPYDLSALPNNETVVRILEAARYSAKTGKKVIWKDFFNNQ